MVDSPTTRNRLRKQELGTNTNTWGDTKLNEVIDAIDQAMDGVLSVALTGNLTLTTSNYSTADQAKRRVLKFTGALSGAVNVIVPSVEHEYSVLNAAGAAVTMKTFAGVGVEIPNGYQARVFCDGIDVYNGSPTLLPGNVRVGGKVRNVTAGTESTDAVNKAQMENAIVGAAIPATPGTVKVSSADTTAGFLHTKLTAASGLVFTISNPGANEIYTAEISSAALLAVNALTPTADTLSYYTGPTSGALTAFTAFARTFVAAADQQAARDLLGIKSDPFGVLNFIGF